MRARSAVRADETETQMKKRLIVENTSATIATRVGRIALLMAACCMAATAPAGVVGWWRFNGEGANVPNVAETGGVPDGMSRATDGTIMSITTYSANPVYGSDETEMPVTTNLFQQVAPRVVDQHVGTVYDGGSTLHFGEDGVKGGVIIPFDEAFVLSNCTVEVIMRIPPEAASRSDRMFPLVQFGRDSYEGWFFAVYRGDGGGGIPYVRGNFVNTSDQNKLNNGSTVTTQSYVRDLPSLFDGKWHHMALTLTHNYYDGAPRVTAAYFIDGVCCGGMTYLDWKSWKLSGNCPLAIGCQPYQGGGTRTFWGDIAEVRISDTVLNENNFLVPLVDGPVDKDTALLLTFDSAAKGLGFSRQYVVPCQQTVGSSNTNYMWTARNWNIHNAATNNPFIPRWFPFADKGNADHLTEELRPTLSTDDTWGDTLGMDATLFSNVGSLNIPTAQPGAAAAPGTDMINIPDPICRLPEGDFTIECVFKTEAASTAEMDTFIHCPFLKWGVTNGKVLARGYKTRYGNQTDHTSTWTVNDGKWHHAAVIYDYDVTDGVTNSVFSHYVDYKFVKKTTMALPVGNIGAGERFFIGAEDRTFNPGVSLNSSQAFRGKIDAVRITRRVLTTGEFLSTRSDEKLMTVTFDDAEHPYAPGQTGAIAPDEGVAGALSGGELPQIVPSRGGWYVLDGEDGTNKVECGNAVQFAGSTLLWQNTTLMERNDLTVEFFARYSDLRDTANILRYVRAAGSSGAQVTDSIIWGLYAQNGTNWRLDILAVTNGVLSTKQSGGNFAPITEADNQWHHWALTVDATSGTNVVAKLYKDYEQLGNTVKLTGRLDLPPRKGYGTGLSIGGTGVAGAYIYGTIDQLRMSAGILDPSKFMRYDKVKSTVIVVR